MSSNIIEHFSWLLLLRRIYSKRQEKGEFASISTRNDVFWSGILNSILFSNPRKTYALCLHTFNINNIITGACYYFMFSYKSTHSQTTFPTYAFQAVSLVHFQAKNLLEKTRNSTNFFFEFFHLKTSPIHISKQRAHAQ